MQKRTLLGVKIISAIEICFCIFFIFQSIKNEYSYVTLLFPLLLIVSSIGMLKLKNWARLMNNVLLFLGNFFNWFMYLGRRAFSQSENPSDHSLGLMFYLILSFSSIAFIYLVLPRVKILFTPPSKEQSK